MVWTEYAYATVAGLSSYGVLEQLSRMDQGSKAEEFSFHLMYWSPQVYLLEGVSTWSLNRIYFAVQSTFCHPQAGTMATEAAF